jgi:hypothetical protein
MSTISVMNCPNCKKEALKGSTYNLYMCYCLGYLEDIETIQQKTTQFQVKRISTVEELFDRGNVMKLNFNRVTELQSQDYYWITKGDLKYIVKIRRSSRLLDSVYYFYWNNNETELDIEQGNRYNQARIDASEIFKNLIHNGYLDKNILADSRDSEYLNLDNCWTKS